MIINNQQTDDENGGHYLNMRSAGQGVKWKYTWRYNTQWDGWSP